MCLGLNLSYDSFYWPLPKYPSQAPGELRFSLQNRKKIKTCMCGQLCLTLLYHGLQPPGSSVHGISRKNTGVSFHFLLQGIFLTKGSSLHLWCLLHWPGESLPWSHPGSPHVAWLPPNIQELPVSWTYLSGFHVYLYSLSLGWPLPIYPNPRSVQETWSTSGLHPSKFKAVSGFNCQVASLLSPVSWNDFFSAQ